LINFDYSSSAGLLPCAIDAMRFAPTANSHAVYNDGVKASLAEHQAQEHIRNLLGVKGGTFYWCGSGSQANYWLIRYLCRAPHSLVTTSIEHKSIDQLISTCGIGIHPKDGRIEVTSLVRGVSEETKLVSLMTINNETGYILPIKEVRLALPNILLHSDMVQALGKYHMEGTANQVDILTISAHKIGGPKGLGAIWVRDNGPVLRLPYLGTHPTESIVAFGAAAQYHLQNKVRFYENIIIAEHKFLQYLRSSGIEFKHQPIYRYPGILSLNLPGIDATKLMLDAGDNGLRISLGSACGEKVSRVLKNFGISTEDILSTVRISLDPHLTSIQVEEGAEILVKLIRKQRS
jgi:cysteine desulfurase